MKRALILLMVGLMTTGLASVAGAGATNDAASIALHVAPVETKVLDCANAPSLTSASVITSGDCLNSEYDVWVFVCNGSDSLGIAGAEFGITYDDTDAQGVEMFGWLHCADLEFKNSSWPASGTGNLITWSTTSNCQDQISEPFVPGTVVAIAGVLRAYAYSADLLSLTPRPASGLAAVADCSANTTDITGASPTQLGQAGFCASGYNPCGAPTPVQPTTWGKLKDQYGN